MKHSNKITAPLSQGEVSSLRDNGEAITSQTTTPSLRDSAQKRGIVAIHTKEKEIDCHESANADSRNDDFPNLPKSWQVKTLGEVLSSDKHSMKRGPFGSSLKKEFFVDSGIRVFEQYNPINQDSDWKRYFITQEKFKELESFKAGAGDLLISCSGTLGKILELPQNVEMGIINQALLKIRLDNTQILNGYFVHLFNSPNMQRIILENTIGSAIQNIASVKVLKQIKIPIPPLEIQRRIVKRLDEAFSRIENGTKHLKSAKDNLTKYKQSLLKSAFNGTLTQDCPLSQSESMSPLQSESKAESSLRENPQGFSWQSTHSLSQGESTHLTHPLAPSAREGEQEDCHALKSPLPCGGDLGVGSTRAHNVVDCHESANTDSCNDENSHSFAGGQSSSPSLNTSGLYSLSPSLAEGARGWVNAHNGESANLPQGWTIKTLGEVCEFAYGKGLESAKRKANGKYPVYAANGIKDYSDEYMIKEQSIIVGRKGSVGSLILTNTPCWVLDVSYYVVFDREKYDLMFLYHLLKTLNLNQYARGVKPGLSRSQAYELKVKIPPLEIQKQIVAILERHFTSADKVSVYIESCLSKAKQLKSSLLKSAFEGELT